MTLTKSSLVSVAILVGVANAAPAKQYNRAEHLANHKRMVNVLTVSLNRECKSASVGDDTMKTMHEVFESRYKDREPPCLANKTMEEIKKTLQDTQAKDTKYWEESKEAVLAKVSSNDEKAKLKACFSAHEKHAEAFMTRGHAWGLYSMLHEIAEGMGVDDVTVEDIHRIMDSKHMGKLSIEGKHPCKFTAEEQAKSNGEITHQWEEAKKEVLDKHNTEKVKQLCSKFDAKLKSTLEGWHSACKAVEAA